MENINVNILKDHFVAIKMNLVSLSKKSFCFKKYEFFCHSCFITVYPSAILVVCNKREERLVVGVVEAKLNGFFLSIKKQGKS